VEVGDGMTKAELMKLATAMANAQATFTAIGMMNTPFEIEKRVEWDAKYKIADSLFRKTREEYEAALANLSAAELDAILKAKEGSKP
jgi:hypothetical protein